MRQFQRVHPTALRAVADERCWQRRMRSLFIFFLLVSAVYAEPHSDYERVIVKKLGARYDFSALTVFLRRVVREHPVFEKVSLASTKIETRWRFEKVDPPSRMRSGDWVIWEKKEEDDGFDLYYQFDATHSVTIRARRLAKDRFELVGLSIEEWVSLR